MKNFDEIKTTTTSTKRVYCLKNTTVYVSSDGYHFTRDLDPIESIVESIDETALDENKSSYIEFALQSNRLRFQNQVEIVKKYSNNSIGRVLDIGCGGGLFLSLLKAEGAEVVGLEIDDARIQFAKKKYGINIVKNPIENPSVQAVYTNYFDIVTLWDVIEHVNFPLATLGAAVNVLKPGGYLLIDTPCRDSFYHRVGEFTYQVSAGRFPTFLNIMYSSHKFGHKQIFSTSEISRILSGLSLELTELRKFHELSFPYEFYIRRLMGSNAANFLSPIASAFFKMLKIKNKVIGVGRKKSL